MAYAEFPASPKNTTHRSPTKSGVLEHFSCLEAHSSLHRIHLSSVDLDLSSRDRSADPVEPGDRPRPVFHIAARVERGA